MGTTFVSILLSVLAVSAAVVAVIFLIVPIFKGLGWVVTNVFKGIGLVVMHFWRFVSGMLGDAVRAVGGLVTTIVFIPLVLGNIVIGRWSAARHYGTGVQDEITGVGHCLYRVVIGHPAKFLLLHGLVEGIEKRLPDAVAQAPGSDKPGKRTGQFDGYTIVGSLQGGGSGGRLYVAEPDERKKAIFARSGRKVDQVVIKVFSQAEGSSLPQIIRESRALEAAKNLGLILDHELTDQRFFYVMQYIPGESLSLVTKRLHAEAGAQGLQVEQLKAALGIMADLLTELHRYHTGGLWHKDIKPDNIIVNQGRAHLVDLGLVTPLRSAMTLTTHGTEYFRDPEMVRMALRGAKVSEVDGVKFDVYGAGAVMFSVIENSFPAHGGLSQLQKTCPEALRWVVRRAMTELHKRYASAAEMLGDVRAVLDAADPFAMKPIDLPSMKGGATYEPPPVPEPEPVGFAAAASPRPRVEEPARDAGAGTGDAPRGSSRSRPKISITDWWKGSYNAEGGASVGQPVNGGAGGRKVAGFDVDAFARDASAAAAAGLNEAARAVNASFKFGKIDVDVVAGIGEKGGARRGRTGTSAADQVRRAQERARTAQARVHTKFGRGGRFSSNPNGGVGVAFFVFLAIGAVIAMSVVKAHKDGGPEASVLSDASREQIKSEIARIGEEVQRGISEGFGDGPVVSVNSDGGSIEETNKVGEALSRVMDAIKSFNHSKNGAAATSATSEAGAGTIVAAAPAEDVLGVGEVNEPAGKVLILNMLPADMAEARADDVREFEQQLSEADLEVLGGSDNPVDEETLAQAKRTVELSQPDDEEAQARVRQWLRSQDGRLAAVLWLGVGKEPGEIAWKLIDRREGR
jgi:hypothetical protein